MATSVGDFLTELGNVPEEECLHLGLTFSFPVEQTALDSGTLLTWTKGFSATGVVGQDVVKSLQDAFNRNGVRVKCVALVNDVRPCFAASNDMAPNFSSDRGHPAYTRVLRG